jgi:hypothetical protein
MPRYDFKCEVCGKVEEHSLPLYLGPEEIKTLWPRHCNELMDKQWARPSFTIKGFSAQNGYSNGTE